MKWFSYLWEITKLNQYSNHGFCKNRQMFQRKKGDHRDYKVVTDPSISLFYYLSKTFLQSVEPANSAELKAWVIPIIVLIEQSTPSDAKK